MGGRIDRSVQNGRAPPCFRICGENYHRIGSLLPPPGGMDGFVQLYVCEPENEVHNRLNAVRNGGDLGILTSTVEGLKVMLDNVNPYVQVFRRARDALQHDSSVNLQICILHSRSNRQYIRPTANEIAALIVGDDVNSTRCRDIIVCKNNGYLKRISETHPSYTPLQYPLLFPYGTDGWRIGIPYNSTSEQSKEGKVSMREFWAFRFQHRDLEGTTILQRGRLYNQLAVDCYAAIEQQRLNYIKTHQAEMRADLYQGLEDAVVTGDTDASAIGRRIILPSSFTEGPRNMMQHYQDAMAICRSMGSLDFFITFTCNPNWQEISKELRRLPDVHVIEFQKRGLPHSHMTLTLAKQDKPIIPDDIDEFICAEIPDKNVDPLAYETVVKCMIYGPCGPYNPNASCMVDGKCSKHYPKKFNTQTTIDEDGFMSYRRRYGPRNVVIINGIEIDNRWVVPYNRDLLVLFNAHINVEKCDSPKLMKYMYKYICKGTDRATIVIENNVDNPQDNGLQVYRRVDEIKQYLDCRYVSAIKACWRIYEFELQRQNPTVERLQYHLPNQQFIVFPNKNFLEARTLTFVEFPTTFVWKRDKKEWAIRTRGKCIGRLPYAHSNSGEKYYLRMLLYKVSGAQSFADIRTFNGTIYPTFKEACSACGLLDDDNEWHQALSEASTWASPIKLHNMFSTMLMFSEITNPVNLWERHWRSMVDDFEYRVRRQLRDNSIHLSDEELKEWGLQKIEHILNTNGKTLGDFPPMPRPTFQTFGNITNRLRPCLMREELDYDDNVEEQSFHSYFSGLNNDQLRIYNAIIQAYEDKSGGLFFVNGSGGTGKTYLWKTIIAKFRSQKRIVLSIASSGIAALLLPGGRTAHSRFKIPFDLHEESRCPIDLNTELAEPIQEASLIIWDKAPMMHRHGFEAMKKPFGGKLCILGGDFKQILTMVTKGRRESIVAASLHKSEIWNQCKVIHLKTNMRLRKARGLLFDDGGESDWIEIPEGFLIENVNNSLMQLIDVTYQHLSDSYDDPTYLKGRVILAPRNSDVDEINSIMQSILPGEVQKFYSVDTVCPGEVSDSEQAINPPELLNSIKVSSISNHCLELKKGAPIMLLRNLNQSLGLCKGTRLTILKMGQKVLEARVITGSHMGEEVLIPRIVLTTNATQTFVPMKRRQLPVKLAFAMTINKSQGQTLDSVGLYLPNPVFTHDQLYVALSRVTNPVGLKILICNKLGIPQNYTRNIVYPEVLAAVLE
ncbi:DNA helicase PIF1/RRM3 [Handroanthus impetiginosus]|uniref:ATP-dependent DNA helicase n=1 Tax=Handroanthus impetiginosus TaxID=429701 RepID=A0A2G9I9M2_9LAMI|nr:DNA helicase PIF1/RRM3 [Handroanthus impetiginosus]